ncbi:MAG: AAA family ATPase [Spirochaetes bacterium]|nr:AAA family ATPase [Spirochaetota bacterium]
MLKAMRFRVQNFRNIDDSDWVPVERVTALVGRNESGKTALLKALHKFQPATPEAYNPQREFPRDRYTRDFKNPADWPVCSVAFEIAGELHTEISKILKGKTPPREAICTRYYDGSLNVEFNPAIPDEPVSPDPSIQALITFAGAARRLQAPAPDQEEATQQIRTALASWASDWQQRLSPHADLRGDEGAKLLTALRKESERHAKPQTADMLEALDATIDPVLQEAQKPSPIDQAKTLIEQHLPVFIYFENYGILDSAVYLPRFLEDLKRAPDEPHIRTVNAMFKHVSLAAQEIAELGHEQAQKARAQNQQPSAETIAQDQQRKEARAIKLNSASLDITQRFNKWYGQRRHAIEYQADGDYFRIWVADDRRPGVRIELEGRSKGFQWFFSFYLVFLVESEEGHKNAILLLDEPGLHLHPTAQQELIAFFERLSEDNQLIYTTHSPFLIDGEHLHRVRPVTEDSTGHSRVSAETWPSDRETIFPLQAAAGYAMVRCLFQHKDNVLVEGMSDYYYLHSLGAQCRASGREALSDDIYITPCGGTKLVGHIASLFLGQKVRPLVLLDGDDAGRARQNALIGELYAAHTIAILMLDDALGRAGTETEIEDILGEEVLLPGVSAVLCHAVKPTAVDRAAGSLPSQIKAWAGRHNVELPDGWKASAAIRLVSQWAEQATRLPDEILDRASALFGAINERFRQMKENA